MRKFGFGIIGTGMIAEYHARAIGELPDAHLIAVHNPLPGLAAAFSEKFGCPGHESLAEFLALPGLDAVTIATPSGLHLDGALAAIAAGKHVVVEKPLEITTERCDRIIQAADAKGVKLAGIFNSRFHPVARIIKRAVEAGRLGTLALADAQVKWYRSQQYYDSGQWRGTWKLDGGGALMNQSIHAVDLLQWFAGPIVDILGRTATLAHQRIEVEDTAVATLRFASGALGMIEGTTCAYPGFLKRIELCGSEGSIVMEEDRLKCWDFARPLPEDDEIRAQYMADGSYSGGAADPSSINHAGHRREFADFIEAVRDNRPPAIDGREARKAVEIIEGVYRSARDGVAVALPLSY